MSEHPELEGGLRMVNDANGQRHDFLLKYYDMAVKDLERHLKFGVDSVSVLAAVVGSIIAAESGDVPAPLALVFALLALLWGAWTLTSANYWAIRAIAFLANVEAFYFSKEDRKNLNKYVGTHPPYHFIDSLGGHAAMFTTLFVVVVLWGAFLLSGAVEGADSILSMLTDNRSNIFWIAFSVLAVVVGTLGVHRYLDRMREYNKFVKDSPGPGLAETLSDIPGAAGTFAESASFECPTSVQSKALGEFGEFESQLEVVRIIVCLLILGTMVLAWCGGFPTVSST